MTRILWATDSPRQAPGLAAVVRQIIRRLRVGASLSMRVLTARRADRPCGTCGDRESDSVRPRRALDDGADRLAHMIARLRPDVIVRTETRGLGRTAAETLAASGAPIIGVAPVNRPYGSLGPNDADALVSLSEFGRNVLDEQGLDSRCIPVGVDCEAFRPANDGAAPREANGPTGVGQGQGSHLK